MLQLQLSTATPASIRSTGAGASAIILSANTIAENAALGAAVGTLSTIGTTGTAVFALVDSAGSRFALSGAAVQRGATALDYEAATSHNIIVSVTGVTPTIANATLAISVTNIAEVPVISTPPTLSPTSGVVGTLITCGTGTWSNSPTSYAYQWMRTGVDISGATSSTYTSVLADDTFTLTCKVLASNVDGPASGYSTTSNSHSVGTVTLALDSYSVGCAYSMRKLRTGYAGNCIRIRASGNNTEANFGFVSNVVDTAGIAAHIATHGGSPYIVTWFDQSGNTVDVTQATAANQPLFVASGINSLPTARYDATDDLSKAVVAGTTISGTDQQTIMCVLKANSSAGNQNLYEWLGSTYMKAHTPYAPDLYYFVGGGINALQVAMPGTWFDNNHILELYHISPQTAGARLDGSIIAEGTHVIFNTTVPATNGTWRLGGGGGLTYVGDLSEFFMLKIDIGSSARSTTRADMGAYYGITVA